MGRLNRLAHGVVVVAALGAGALAVACGDGARAQRPADASAGDPEIGRRLISTYGCGSCHRIPGVPAANGLVGPPLDAMGKRSFIAGELANNQENMVRWITDPQKVEPGTAMPDLHVTEDDARQIAAYLAGLE
jgi:cytochrome c